MKLLVSSLLILFSLSTAGQSKSIDRFRKAFKEDNNVFIYSSTLKMLNTDDNPEFSDLVKGIEEIRVLNYKHKKNLFNQDEIFLLKNNLRVERYNELLVLSEKENKIFLYGKEKREKMTGFVALIDNKEQFIIIDVVGSLDFTKFLQLKNKLDTKL